MPIQPTGTAFRTLLALLFASTVAASGAVLLEVPKIDRHPAATAGIRPLVH